MLSKVDNFNEVTRNDMLKTSPRNTASTVNFQELKNQSIGHDSFNLNDNAKKILSTISTESEIKIIIPFWKRGICPEVSIILYFITANY